MSVFMFVIIVFFTQKTAYEMRISDCSSDVCSSDLGQCSSVVRIGCEIALEDDAGFLPLPRLPVHARDAVGVAVVMLAREHLVEDRLAFGLEPAEVVDTRHADPLRSEEHTSELQSLMRISSAVFCLKKKTHHNYKLPCLN